ncbi:hypothetical protein KIPB_002464 [Kipferlia bialata]|uniref:Uncharacterized protein n=1 Tax=Kipferlia bialata TaxID=797122 RepID=A0A9K3CTV8_9EUKA|nr:hypothetical protein KIPB_002464 [Kipferlia bialata]|eukprot:g2464.t1
MKRKKDMSEYIAMLLSCQSVGSKERQGLVLDDVTMVPTWILRVYCRHFTASCVSIMVDERDPFINVSDAQYDVVCQWMEDGHTLLEMFGSSIDHSQLMEESSRRKILPPFIWHEFCKNVKEHGSVSEPGLTEEEVFQREKHVFGGPILTLFMADLVIAGGLGV